MPIVTSEHQNSTQRTSKRIVKIIPGLIFPLVALIPCLAIWIWWHTSDHPTPGMDHPIISHGKTHYASGVQAERYEFLIGLFPIALFLSALIGLSFGVWEECVNWKSSGRNGKFLNFPKKEVSLLKFMAISALVVGSIFGISYFSLPYFLNK